MALASSELGRVQHAPVTQSVSMISVDEAEIKRILTNALGRESGLRLTVRQCFLNEKGDNPLTFRQAEEPAVSGVKVLGMTMRFCIGNLEYRVAGQDDMRRLNAWLVRANAAIPKHRAYNHPDARVLFRAFTTLALN